MSGKRSRVITVAAAGTLTLAAAISAAAVTLPAGTVAAPNSSAAAYMTVVSGQHGATRATQAVDAMAASQRLAQFSLTARHHADERTVVKAEAVRAAAVRAAAAKAAAARAAAAKAAAVQAAAEQAAQQAAAAQPAATAQAAQPVAVQAAPVASGTAQQIAEGMLSSYGWSSSQFSCLEPLWAEESGWNVTAENPSSGAYGIPQAMPGSEMASAGADWQTDAATQIRWGLSYIQGRYGSPCGAWAHEESDGWY
jgi:hypothetical protein